MNDNEANELRLIANEIMHRLWEAGQLEQLRILERYAASCQKIKAVK